MLSPTQSNEFISAQAAAGGNEVLLQALSALLENLPDTWSLIDANHRLLYQNPSGAQDALERFGYCPQPGDSTLEGLEPNMAKAFQFLVDVALEGQVTDKSNFYQLRDGRKRLLREILVPVGSPGAAWAVAYTAQDITNQWHQQQSLIEAEARFVELANAAPILIWLSDTEKQCYFFNETWLHFTGRSTVDEYGYGWATGVHPDDVAQCKQTYESAFDRREPFEMTYRLRHHTGQYRWLLDHGRPRYNAAGQFLGYIGSCTDIHEQKTKADFLDMFTHVAQEMTTAIAVTGANRQIEWVNQAFCQMTGYSMAEALGKKLKELVQSHETPKAEINRLRTALAHQQRVDAKLVNRRKDGSLFHTTVSITPLVRDGKIHKYITLIRDVSNEIALQQKIAQQEAMQLRIALEAQEAERARLASELHDGLAVRLSAFKMKLSTWEYEKQNGHKPIQMHELTSMCHEMDSIMTDLRGISHGLFPHQLRLKGLGSAIERFLEQVQTQTGIEAVLETQSTVFDALNEGDALAVYRIVTELVNNTLKHANATAITLKATFEPDHSIRLEYLDNGVGMDPSLWEERPGFGLASIQTRVRVLKGRIEVKSQPGLGLLVKITFPVAKHLRS
jgi:PAS domain S-box-containing protein